MSSEDVHAFREWIGRSPKHYEEIRRIARLSSDVNILTQLREPIETALAEQRAVIRRARPWYHRHMRHALLSVAAVACIAVIGINFSRITPPVQPYVIATDIGGYSERTLSDGSVVKLNTNSQIEVDFDATSRRVRLIKGEVFFDVTHNAERPFIVLADDKIVRAIGTAFSVRWTEGDLSVVVSDGRVAFTPLVDTSNALEIEPAEGEIYEAVVKSSDPIFLDAGQKLRLSENKRVEVVAVYSETEIRSEHSWQSGILDFSNRPLEDVVREVNRYTDIRIEISDPALRDLKFGGIFRTGETQQLFEALVLSGLEVEHLSDTHVEISKRPEN